MIALKVKKWGSIGEITVSGKLTVQHAAQFKKTLLKALKKAKHVIVIVGENAKVDLPFLQLLCSAHRSALRLKKDLRLSYVNQEVVKAIDTVGYSHRKNCTYADGKGCIWLIEGSDAQDDRRH